MSVKSLFASEKYRLISLYAIGVLYALIRIAGGLTISEDSPSYINAFDLLMAGDLHTWRTPVYPLIVGAIRSVSGSWFYLNLQIFQYMLFFVGFHFFYKLATELIDNKYIVYIISVIYMASPCTIGTCSRLLTESVSISLFVIFAYLTVRMYAKRVGWAQYAFLVILGPVLILLRPSFIYILVVLLVVAATLAFRSWRRALVPAVAFVAILATYMGYSNLFYRQHGLASTTVVGIVNIFHIERQNGYFDCSVIDDEKMREDFRNIFFEYKGSDHQDYYDECFEMMDTYGAEKVNDVLIKNIVKHPSCFIKGMLFRAGEQNTAQGFPILCFRGDLGPFNFVQRLWEIVIPLPYTVWIIAVYLVMMGLQYCRQRKVPYRSLCLFLLIAGSYSLVLISAMGEWARLNYTVFPFVLIAAGQIFNRFNYSLNKSFVFA